MSKGIVFALLAALLFGASTPLATRLLPQVEQVLMVGLFYSGSGRLFQGDLRLPHRARNDVDCRRLASCSQGQDDRKSCCRLKPLSASARINPR